MSTAGAAPQWVLDPNRNEYYYYLAAYDCYVYQTTGVLNSAGQPIPDPRVPRTAPQTTAVVSQHHASSSVDSTSAAYTSDRPAGDEAANALSRLTLNEGQSTNLSRQPYGGGEAEPASSSAPLVASRAVLLTASYQTPTQYTYERAPRTSQASQAYGYQAQQTGYQAQQSYQAQQPVTGQQSNQYGQQQTAANYAAQQTPSVNTSIAANQSQSGALQGAKFVRGGTPGTAEPFNPGKLPHCFQKIDPQWWLTYSTITDFVVQRDQERFFQPGRVFKLYWPEPVGESRPSGTTITGGTPNGVFEAAWGQRFYAKIRWFVVIRRIGQGFCSCLCIQTYGGRGTAKRGTIKGHHSIIHTSREPPEPMAGEAPNLRRQEAPMLSPIRVRANKRIDKLEHMSRLNYAKVYNVEHNVKVYDFGVVHEGYMDILCHQFNSVWVLQVPPAAVTDPVEDEEDEDDDEEEEEQGNDGVGEDTQGYAPIQGPVSRETRGSSSKGKERSRSGGAEDKKKKVGFTDRLTTTKEPRKRRK
ncbi:hypothetical protein FKW77_004708 [Venturia effusa]|uniref:DUF6590 domain-containing protein n=1 Tax=Venturia effusa TaxID=50376 RepID=A0A517L1A2_9PEZI|nr:hypothetical protein FKW77_004708 [Venturia effusa]